MVDTNPDLERDKRIENAVRDVEEGSIICKATSKWDMSQSTVQDKCSGQTKGMRCSPPPSQQRQKKNN